MLQHYVAISLFVTVEKAPLATVDDKLAFGTYFIRWVDGHIGRAIGLAHVARNDSAPANWNRQMRDGTLVYSVWSNDDWGPWPAPGGRVPDRSALQPVQLATVYPVRALTEIRAAKAAWALLLGCDRSNTEWYDASADKRWSKLFRQ